MAYLLQAEEREISFELLQDLALILTESPGVIFADATRRIRVSCGILEFETREEAERVSARFAGLNFRTFVVDQLLDAPAPKLLNVETAKLADEISLAAAGRVDIETERTVTTVNPLRLRVAYPRIPIPSSVIDEQRVKETDTEYYLDLFTTQQHWRVKRAFVGPFPEFVKGLSLSDALVGAGVRSLLAGNRTLPRFTSNKDYNRYLTWLYQLRFAER